MPCSTQLPKKPRIAVCSCTHWIGHSDRDSRLFCCKPLPSGRFISEDFRADGSAWASLVFSGCSWGVIRRRGGGMFAPWIAHVFTDVVIAGIVLLLARPDRPNQAMQRSASQPAIYLLRVAIHPLAASHALTGSRTCALPKRLLLGRRIGSAFDFHDRWWVPFAGERFGLRTVKTHA